MKGAVRKIGMAVMALGVSLSLTGCMGLHALMGSGCGGMMGGGHGSHQEASKSHERHAPAPAIKTVSCPVCGKSFAVSEQTPRFTHEGTLYYFDSEEHAKEFVKEPEQFVHPESKDQEGGGHQHESGK